MRKSRRTRRFASPLAGRLVGLLLLGAIATAVASPAAAGIFPGCCICGGCATPPATQCFQSPAPGCEAQCASLNCAQFSQTAIGCPMQPECAPFEPPAPAPALTPGALAGAVLALAALGRRALRRG